MDVWKNYMAEFIGTMAIVLIGCGTIVVNQLTEGMIPHMATAMAFGLVVMVMVETLGHISGAHFNPAVTLAFAFRRHFPKKQIFPYLLAQCFGAITASLIHVLTLSSLFQQRFPDAMLDLGVTRPVDGRFLIAFIWEILLTFFLMFVIMGVATDYRASGKTVGVPIGGTVGVCALLGGPLSGASMNPARSLGPALISGDVHHLWVYVAGPILGAVLGALVYDFLRCESQAFPK